MFPVDMPDFYLIFFHIKKLSALSNPNRNYVKKEKVLILSIVLILCSKSINSIDTKFFRYLPSLIQTISKSASVHTEHAPYLLSEGSLLFSFYAVHTADGCAQSRAPLTVRCISCSIHLYVGHTC